jgi:hypothetical protein
MKHSPEIRICKWLERWLNKGEDREGDKARIAGLLLLSQRLERLLQGSPKKLEEWPQEIFDIQDQIRVRMEPYAGRPGFAADVEGKFVKPVLCQHSGGGSTEEWQALGYLQNLARIGWLRRVALCDVCGKCWVFRHGRRLHCSNACRQAKYESKPARKRAKKKWQRKAYEALWAEARRFRPKRKGRK